MERKSSPLVELYGKVDLYYEDLQAIYDRLKSKTDDTTIETPHYIFKDFDEFISQNKKITTLKIQSYRLRIYLSVNKDFSKLEGSDFFNDNFARTTEVFYYINGIVRECKRKSISSYKALNTIITFMALVEAVDLPLKFLPHNDILNVCYGLINSLCIWIVFDSMRVCRVYTNRKESIGFWQRKKDDIYVVVISVLLATIVTGLCSHYLPSKP